MRKSSVGGGWSTLTCSVVDHELLQKKEEHYYWVLVPQVSEKIQQFVANLSSDLRVTCKEMSE